MPVVFKESTFVSASSAGSFTLSTTVTFFAVGFSDGGADSTNAANIGIGGNALTKIADRDGGFQNSELWYTASTFSLSSGATTWSADISGAYMFMAFTGVSTLVISTNSTGHALNDLVSIASNVSTTGELFVAAGTRLDGNAGWSGVDNGGSLKASFSAGMAYEISVSSGSHSVTYGVATSDTQTGLAAAVFGISLPFRSQVFWVY